jgi:hypothetical protein
VQKGVPLRNGLKTRVAARRWQFLHTQTAWDVEILIMRQPDPEG